MNALVNALPGWGIVAAVLLLLVEDHVVAVECDGEETMVARMQDLWSVVPIQGNSSSGSDGFQCGLNWIVHNQNWSSF